jgi:hypothetical protein
VPNSMAFNKKSLVAQCWLVWNGRPIAGSVVVMCDGGLSPGDELTAKPLSFPTLGGLRPPAPRNQNARYR